MATGDRSLRHFYCRDAYWECCERMASDFECSIDFIINDAMRHYARIKRYPVAAAVGTPPEPPAVPKTPALFLHYQGQRYTISQDEFTIGRAAKNSDLAIKDPNISRQHAAVIRQGGAFYIEDRGSVNGLHFQGLRIANKRIDEGDRFQLSGHLLVFTYR